MNTLTGLLLMVVVGTICFFLGIRVALWGDQSREEEWSKLFAQQAELQNRTMKMMREQPTTKEADRHQSDAWINKFSAVRLLYYELIFVISREQDTTHPACLRLREEIDEAFSTYLPKD